MGFLRASIAVLAVLAWTAADAQAQEGTRGSFDPRAVGLPPNWTTPPSQPAPRLTRTQPTTYYTGQVAAPARVRQPGLTRTGVYDITSGPFRPRGPVEVRDYWILAQPRMTLPAVSPDAPRHGSWTINFHIDRGNDFGWEQDVAGDNPTDRRFIVDGEHQSTELRVRYGFLPRLSFGIRVPVYWRGGGFMDAPIDWFHELFEGIGFLDNGRPAFTNDQYRVNGRLKNGDPFSWDDKRGTALGNIDLEAYWHILKACDRCDWRLAWIFRAALPTGGDPYDTGLDLGTQLVAAKNLGGKLSRFDIYGGIGGTWYSDDTVDGVEYEPFRIAAFGAVEWHMTSRWSWIVETNFASRMITNIDSYPAESWYINVSTRYDITQCFEVYLGFTENIIDQQGTIDFGGFAGFTLRL